MKQLLIFSIFMMGFAGSLYSQEMDYQKPDYDQIEKEVKDSVSLFYYPYLMERFENADVTLTKEDFRHLYFGYLFHKNFKPYRRSPHKEELLKYYQAEEIKTEDYDEIIRLATLCVSDVPFDLSSMNFLAYVYYLKGDMEMEEKISFKFSGILDAIISSGNGKSCKTAFHVISVDHEYVVLNVFQLKSKSQALTKDLCDCITIKGQKENVYFNVKQFFGKGLD